VHALIKNNEPATIVAQAILPMLFVSIDRKYLLLTIFKASQRADPRVYGRINRAEVSFPGCAAFDVAGTYLDPVRT
jgi:hypothetical protein